MVDKKTVMKVAHLARLHVSEDKAAELQSQFTNILGHFNKIQDVACDHIEPMLSPNENPGFQREDKVVKEVTVDEILHNAPEAKGHLFKVPPVV